MIAGDITKAREVENNGETHNSSTSGGVVLFLKDNSGVHTRIVEEATYARSLLNKSLLFIFL